MYTNSMLIMIALVVMSITMVVCGLGFMGCPLNIYMDFDMI